MAHIQNKPVHDSEAQHKKDFQAVNAKSAAAGNNHRSHQTGETRVDNAMAHRLNETPSHEFMVMGFPWQFVAVVGVIVGSVLIIVLRTIGLF